MKRSSAAYSMYCRFMITFNRWQCDPHFKMKASASSNMGEFRITTCNFCDVNCLTAYLSISVSYAEKVAECAILHTIFPDKHTREQPTATTSDSCKVNV